MLGRERHGRCSAALRWNSEALKEDIVVYTVALHDDQRPRYQTSPAGAPRVLFTASEPTCSSRGVRGNGIQKSCEKELDY